MRANPSHTALNHTTPHTRIQRVGQSCTCFVCGIEVYPLPLALDPTLRARRGYAVVSAAIDRKTRELRFQPHLLCAACADPADVWDYAQFESALTYDAATHDARITVAEATQRAPQL